MIYKLIIFLLFILPISLVYSRGTIAHDNSDLYLSENNMIVKKILKKYCIYVDNLLRLATPLIFSIYIGALINGR